MPAAEIQSIVLQIAGREGAEDAMNAAEELIERGRAEGEAKGKATALLQILAARGLEISQDARARILACQDLTRLDAWLTHALTATSVAEALS